MPVPAPATRDSETSVAPTRPSSVQAWPPRWSDGTVPERLQDATIVDPLIEAHRDAVLVRLPGIGRFLARRAEPIVVERYPSTTDDDVRCFVEGPVITAAWLLDGTLTLRGGAVAIDGRGVIVIGPPAGGTSTAIAALGRRGHAILADRVTNVDLGDADTTPTVAVRDHQPQLWPASWKLLELDPADATVVRPALSKRRFAIGPAPHPVPLATIVVLKPRRVVELTIEQVRGADIVSRLLAHDWHARLVAGLGLDGVRFGWATTLAGRAHVVRLTVPERMPPHDLAAAIEHAVGGPR